MTTKIYGVSMEDVQKLRQFQFLFMKRKCGIKACNKMVFLRYVQFKSEKILVPDVTRISIVDNNIHIDDSVIIISKSLILKIIGDNNTAIVKLKRPVVGFGSYISFDFTNIDHKVDFINFIGPIEDNESDSSDQDGDDTPPTSESIDSS